MSPDLWYAAGVVCRTGARLFGPAARERVPLWKLGEVEVVPLPEPDDVTALLAGRGWWQPALFEVTGRG
jgi:hypothetical protein